MTNKSFEAAVVGGGMVGSAIQKFYGNIKIYDKYKSSDPLTEVAQAQYIFIAVPTPYQAGQDLTEMDDALARVVGKLVDPKKQVIIIKSTVLPGTTEAYQQEYPEVNFVFNPEFLTEATAAFDFAYPDKQLVGYTSKTKAVAEEVMKILPDAPYKKVLPASICELVKYATNAYYAFKVIFGNQIYDLCKALEIDYNSVREGLVADRRIIDTHFDIFYGGYRGFGGKCIPKDLKTLAFFAKDMGASLRFIEQIIKINEQLMGSQKNE